MGTRVSVRIIKRKKTLSGNDVRMTVAGGKEDGSAGLEKQTDKLNARIGQLEMEDDLLKKNIEKPVSERRSMIDTKHRSMSVVKQCKLLGLHRSGFYYKPCSETQENLTVCRQNKVDFLFAIWRN